MEPLYCGLEQKSQRTSEGDTLYGKEFLNKISEEDLFTELKYRLENYRGINRVSITNIINIWDTIKKQDDLFSKLSKNQKNRLQTCLRYRSDNVKLGTSPSSAASSYTWLAGRVERVPIDES